MWGLNGYEKDNKLAKKETTTYFRGFQTAPPISAKSLIKEKLYNEFKELAAKKPRPNIVLK